jgi:hypothetical protein
VLVSIEGVILSLLSRKEREERDERQPLQRINLRLHPSVCDPPIYIRSTPLHSPAFHQPSFPLFFLNLLGKDSNVNVGMENVNIRTAGPKKKITNMLGPIFLGHYWEDAGSLRRRVL